MRQFAHGHRGHPGNVRADKHIIERQQWMVRRRGLRLKDINTSTSNSARLQSSDQGAVVDQWKTVDVTRNSLRLDRTVGMMETD
jgi:acetolactate synthase regulatory subunit